MNVLEEAVEAAEEVNSVLGGSYTENIYHRALMRELSERGVPFSSEGSITVYYKDAPIGRRRPDLFLFGEDGDTIVVELKATATDTGHEQLAEYLDLCQTDDNFGDITAGLLINFGDTFHIEKKDLSDSDE